MARKTMPRKKPRRTPFEPPTPRKPTSGKSRYVGNKKKNARKPVR